MSTIPLDDLAGVFSVPPLPRKRDAKRSLDFDAAECVARHIEAGGISRLLYGGNAFLYHIALGDSQHRPLVRPRHGSGADGPAASLPDGDAPALRRSTRSGGTRGRDPGD